MAYFTVMESAVRLRDEEHYGGLLVLPGLVQDWIRGFDRGEPVEPISFELELPWEQTTALPVEVCADDQSLVPEPDFELLPCLHEEESEAEALVAIDA